MRIPVRSIVLLLFLTALPLWADLLPRRGQSASVVAGLVIAIAVIAGGIWWIRRRRKRS
jgi:LPXTG-motif cell wall-anchored protein